MPVDSVEFMLSSGVTGVEQLEGRDRADLLYYCRVHSEVVGFRIFDKEVQERPLWCLINAHVYTDVEAIAKDSTAEKFVKRNRELYPDGIYVQPRAGRAIFLDKPPEVLNL